MLYVFLPFHLEFWILAIFHLLVVQVFLVLKWVQFFERIIAPLNERWMHGVVLQALSGLYFMITLCFHWTQSQLSGPIASCCMPNKHLTAYKCSAEYRASWAYKPILGIHGPYMDLQAVHQLLVFIECCFISAVFSLFFHSSVKRCNSKCYSS